MSTSKHQAPQLPQTDVKCRFFAQYWGQLYEFKNTKTKWRVNEGAFPLEKEGNERLILTDLKNITDEDLEFIYQNNKINTGVDDDEIYPSKKLANFCESDIYLADYLRSKGYALPFMEYSVKDLVSFDWIRLV